VRKLESYVRKYGPETGPKLYHALQSQAAHASVSARLRRKIDVLTGKTPAQAAVVPEQTPGVAPMPLFPGLGLEPEPGPEPRPVDKHEHQPEPFAVGA
jgi:hypothetical protein